MASMDIVAIPQLLIGRNQSKAKIKDLGEQEKLKGQD
ncbi:hypothetical protein Tco_0521454, partial [Tanacetum coccineum]